MEILSPSELRRIGILAAALILMVLSAALISSEPGTASPLAAFSFEPAVGNTSSVIKFNASQSSNPGGNFSELSFRWDWEDDGLFDTPWSNNCTAEHQFTSSGVFRVRLEARNLTAQVGNATALVPIDGSAPVVTLLLSEGGAFKNGSKVSPGQASIVCLAVDDLSSIASVEYSLDAEAFKNVSSSTGLNQTIITLNGLADGDHYLIVRVTNSAGLATLVGVEFKASAAVAQDPPLDSMWIVVTLMIVVLGIIVSILLIRSRWRNDPPQKLDLAPPGLPPVM